MKYILIIIISLITVFNQIFFFDQFNLSLQVISLLISYLIVTNVSRTEKQYYLFFIYLTYEFLILDKVGMLTLIVLLLEAFFNFIKTNYKLTNTDIFESLLYFSILYAYNDSLFTPAYFLNFGIISLIFIWRYYREYGLTKSFRRRD